VADRIPASAHLQKRHPYHMPSWRGIGEEHAILQNSDVPNSIGLQIGKERCFGEAELFVVGSGATMLQNSEIGILQQIPSSMKFRVRSERRGNTRDRILNGPLGSLLPTLVATFEEWGYSRCTVSRMILNTHRLAVWLKEQDISVQGILPPVQR
jgi:hypothetical protein